MQEVNKLKFLGVTIDCNMTWKYHTQTLKRSLTAAISILFRVSKFLPSHTLKLLYHTLIQSKITYCVEVWGNCAQIHKNSLIILQKRAIRLISHAPPLSPSAPLFKNSNILPLEYLYQYKLLLIAHAEFQKRSSFTPAYETRHSLLSLQLPMSTSATSHRQVSYRSHFLWNGLPTGVRLVRSPGPFSRALRGHLLSLV